MKSVLIALMFIALCVPNAVSQSATAVEPDRTVGSAEVYYLKDKNKSRAQVTLHPLSDHNARTAEHDALRMDLIFESKGLKVITPQYFFIAFSSQSRKGPRYRNAALTIFTRDIKGFTRTIYGTRMLSSSNKPAGGSVEVFVSSAIPYSRFREILSALDTSITVGGTVFKLKKEDVNAITDLSRTIEN